MELPSYFEDFLAKIRPTEEEVDEYVSGHKELRRRIVADEDLSSHVVGTFLQGSYRRSTALKSDAGGRSDVDVVVVTDFDSETVPVNTVIDKFTVFLENHDDYKKSYSYNAHSISIELEKVKLDLVMSSAPSEVQKNAVRALSELTRQELSDLEIFSAEDWVFRASGGTQWKTEPIWIPNRDLNAWEQTHPLEQIRWTAEHNAATNRYYVNVVKAIKWWRRTKVSRPERPKGYPVEHMVGTYCPIGITSIAQGVVQTLERIAGDPTLQSDALMQRTPSFPDRGIPGNNVFEHVSGADFAGFFPKIEEAAVLARLAIDASSVAGSAAAWRDLFGDEFPSGPEGESGKMGGYTPRNEPSVVGPGRFG